MEPQETSQDPDKAIEQEPEIQDEQEDYTENPGKNCEICGSPMHKASKILIKDTYYYIWKCKKCKHEVARSQD